MPLKKHNGKEFSFEKNENVDQNYFIAQDINITAHFNKFNFMSKGKDSSNIHSSNSGLKDKQRPHYHCHYAYEDKVAPDAFTLDPSSSARNSTSMIYGDHSRKVSLNLKMSMPLPIQEDLK